ncbi:DPM1, dolichol-phosphate mannosyltransferase [Nostoc flagelliforme CCNUN1]|uniref:DPM1, dolichol-phosphate mannosyltransferase n=1 Tax=Nostoc flagelliforme CCNUN1 TaxID=2038116 RepID=A0A2K8SJ51_9NOSO|nr:glycosyltransferase family 2 protein [Nostoc flagelliforme]AUB34845.1 DPM1, dolichol-phosphate mannosyltransferase [Nostoc flagelliforme CCNUN1]
MLPKYSLIVPIYNEEEIIPELYRRLSAVMNRLDGLAELILINDGSRDRSLQLLRELHQKDPRICYLSFARNFGHQIAVTAGLNFVRGQVIIILDADLQDPPELIPDMIEKWRQGYLVVYAQRTQRLKEGWFKRFTAYSFYRVLKKLADVEIPTDTGDFCLMDRQIVDILNSMPERTRYIRGLRSWVGFQQTAIRFERNPRFAGEVKYTFSKSLALAINGLVSFSIVPLRISTYLGLVAAAAAILMALLVLYWRLFVPHSPLTGFTIILMAIFFLGSVQLVSVGILGEYIGRIYEEVKARPLYTLAEVGGFYDNSNSTNNSDKLDNFEDATKNLDKY